jgi:hypothetical protein
LHWNPHSSSGEIHLNPHVCWWNLPSLIMFVVGYITVISGCIKLYNISMCIYICIIIYILGR